MSGSNIIQMIIGQLPVILFVVFGLISFGSVIFGKIKEQA